MAYPNDLKYTRDHKWIRLGDSDAQVGITDLGLGEHPPCPMADRSNLSQRALETFGDLLDGRQPEGSLAGLQALALDTQADGSQQDGRQGAEE